jgi:hypothetical protein
MPLQQLPMELIPCPETWFMMQPVAALMVDGPVAVMSDDTRTRHQFGDEGEAEPEFSWHASWHDCGLHAFDNAGEDAGSQTTPDVDGREHWAVRCHHDAAAVFLKGHSLCYVPRRVPSSHLRHDSFIVFGGWRSKRGRAVDLVDESQRWHEELGESRHREIDGIFGCAPKRASACHYSLYL